MTTIVLRAMLALWVVGFVAACSSRHSELAETAPRICEPRHTYVRSECDRDGEWHFKESNELFCGTKDHPRTDREERAGFDVNTHVACGSGSRPPSREDFIRSKYPAYDDASCKVVRQAQLILPMPCSNGLSSSWVHPLFDCANGSRVVDFKSGGPTLAHKCNGEGGATLPAVTR